MVQLHYARFYRPKVNSILCMSLHKKSLKLALARSDNSVEIWNLSNVPFIERIIPYIVDLDLQGLQWCRNQLYSVDLQGFLNEYDLRHLSLKNKTSVTGEAAYCMDVDNINRRIAVGTEQGYINIFSVDEDEITFQKFLDKQEGKILCIRYDKDHKHIVTCSIDAIRIFNVENGHALHKMTPGRSETNKETIIWCMEVINDFVIVTGDSRGKLVFWDGKIGAQIESFQSHRADILAITVSEDEETLFCGGVDPNLISYSKVKVKDQKNRWVKSIQRKVHDHDVKCLILSNSKLYSGGVDGYLTCSYHRPKTLVKYPPFLQNNCVTTSAKAKFLLLQYSDCLDVWRLGSSSSNETDNTGFLRVDEMPKKLVSVERRTKDYFGNPVNEAIICGSISLNGQWIIYSTRNALNLLEFDFNDENKLKLIPNNIMQDCGVCSRVAFTPDSAELILVTTEDIIFIYDLQNLCVKQKIQLDVYMKDLVTFLTISPDGKYFALSDAKGGIGVWTKDDSWRFYCRLPKYEFPPTALSISPTNNLVVAYSDHKIIEYVLNEKRLSKFSKEFDSAKLSERINKHLPIRNITFSTYNENLILLHDDTCFVVIDKNGKGSEKQREKKMLKMEGEQSDPTYAVTAFKDHQHLLHLDCLSDKEYVAVQVNPLHLLEDLPPCFKQTPFGTK